MLCSRWHHPLVGISDPISPFDRYIFAHKGLCLFGEAIPIAIPDAMSLKAQSSVDLQHFAHPPIACVDSAIWLAGIMHWLARTIVFWRDGVLLSKTAALEREIAAEGPLATVFRLPLSLRREGSAACHLYLDELRQNYLNAIGPALKALEEL